MTPVYPAADTRSKWYQTRHPGVQFKPEKIVLHTIEGGAVYDYDGGGVAPTFSVDMVAGKVWQHYPVNVSARALKHPAGTPATNTDGAVQIEIVGTCDPRSKVRPFVPGMPVAGMKALTDLLRWISDETGIPLVSTPRPWVAYPASYGSKAGQRMTWAEWDAFRGVCGHQHVPGNDHGDPGAFPIVAVLTAARGGKAPAHVTTATPAGPAGKYAGDPARELVWGAFPLPVGHWYGVDDGTDRSHSGKRPEDARAVRQIQRTVNAPADGVIGPQTVTAIKAAQQRAGLTADGLVGPGTWAALAK